MSLSLSDDDRRIPLAPCPDCNKLMPEEQERCQQCDMLKGNYVKVSEAAIERAAKLLCAANNLGLDYWESYHEDSLIKEKFRDQARAVVAALREEA